MAKATQAGKKTATLMDVARLAGVSTATVARVLHGTGHVSEARRAKVEQAVLQTGYEINAVAQGLRKQKTLVIGHILNSIASNPFFATVAMGVEEAAAHHNCGVLTVFANEDEDIEHASVKMLIQRRVDAIVFTTANHESSIRLAQQAGIPVIQVERAGVADAHAVTVDNYHGSRSATQHLIDLGHQRISYVGVMPPNPQDTEFQHRRTEIERERVAGFRDAILDSGLVLEDDLIELCDGYFDFEHVKNVVRSWVTGSSSVTAVFAGTDAFAAAILQELYRLNLRVPDDISLVGFDDTYAEYLTPRLTTVSQPMLELGRTSANAAIELAHTSSTIARSEVTEEDRRLATHLIVRESTGPAKAS